MSKPTARDRLAQAAFDLFDERGYEQTTVDDITERAGVRLVLLRYLGEGDLARRRYALTSTVPALRDREIAAVARYQRLFREFIAGWTGASAEPDLLRAELAAAAVVAAHNHVLRRWLRAESADPVAELDDAMRLILGLFTASATVDSGAGHDDHGTTIVAFRTGQDLEALLPALQRLTGEPADP